MTRKSVPFLWMGVAFAIAAILAGAVLGFRGTDADSVVAALKLTARWSFLLFWVAYTGGAMAAFFGPKLVPLGRRGREFGLAFAAAHLVHVGLVVWLYRISAKPPLPWSLFVFFAIGIFWTYLLAALSFGGAQAMGVRRWGVVRVVGMNFILLDFAYDFLRPVVRGGVLNSGFRGWVEYMPFAVMTVLAPLLLVAAAMRRRRGMRPAPA